LERSWKRRWFVLGLNSISYYRRENETRRVLGLIYFSDVTKVEISATRTKRQNHEIIEIQTPRRTYFMYADSTEEQVEWIEAINRGVDIAWGRIKEEDDKQETRQITIDDFDMLKVVGKGSYGTVVQVRLKDTGDIFALKVIDKKFVVEKNEIEHTISERNILSKTNHPFIMKLYFAFQTSDKLFFYYGVC